MSRRYQKAEAARIRRCLEEEEEEEEVYYTDTQSHNWNSQLTTYDIVTPCRLKVTHQYIEHTYY
jgi:transposase-like protein